VAVDVTLVKNPGDIGANCIRFILDEEIVEAKITDPTRTVLQYLREDLRRTGTKEGCAEGDCGACTVVIGDLDSEGRLQFRAVNSCIKFLPTLDGKLLLTVESLSGPGDVLHPVQKAMIDKHGSQCGFCTPGFVMSLYALYKTQEEPTRTDIDNALSGNLCRCTGYRPIIDAALTMYDHEVQGELSSTSREHRPGEVGPSVKGHIVELLQSIKPQQTTVIDDEGKQFFAPRSVPELCELINCHPGAHLLAGGTDLGLWVTKQLRQLNTVIYLGGVENLDRIEVDGNCIEIGATASLTDAMKVICDHYPDLEELFIRFASPPIRNAGTLGGNVANGSPIGDSMPALIALGAQVVLQRTGSSRELPLDEFYLGYQKKDLMSGEFLESIRVPLPVPGLQLRSYKVSKRFDQDISAVCGAYCLNLDGDIVRDIRIAYGGMAAIAQRAVACEQVLRHQEWTEATVHSAMDALDNDFVPITDMRAGSDYRSTVARNLLYRFFLETSANAGISMGVYRFGR